MRATRLGRVLSRSVLAALAAPTLVACTGDASRSAPDAGSIRAHFDADSGLFVCPGYSMPNPSSAVDAGELPSGCASVSGAVTNACGQFFDLVGPATACSANATGDFNTYLSVTQCEELCPPRVDDASPAGTLAISCEVYGQGFAQTAGTPPPSVFCTYDVCCHGIGGRRPEGLVSRGFEGPGAAARFLAETAFLEAASVDAFERLARELEAHGAPARLRSASRRAARDEVRHAGMMKMLAGRAGGRVPEVHVETGPVRSLEDIAVENAVEGCVRETFGAAVAMIQAQRARDERVRRTMRRIARDETRHAELSWAVARWIDTRLDAAARRRVREARTRAVEALAREAAREPDASLTGRLGVPDASQARALLDALAARLWSTPLPALSA